jgi:hypothetical protein
MIVCTAAASHAAGAPEGWTTYRSDELGYALSFPSTTALPDSSGGRSATLVDVATGERLVELEAWPPDPCPPHPPGTTAKRLGMERAAVTTRTDGPEGGSACEHARITRENTSAGGVRYWELELECSGGGTKGPTLCADVSQPWRTRVLMVDPVGVDPRRPSPRRPVEPSFARRILDTLTVLPVARPAGICIEDLR